MRPAATLMAVLITQPPETIPVVGLTEAGLTMASLITKSGITDALRALVENQIVGLVVLNLVTLPRPKNQTANLTAAPEGQV